MSHSLFDHDAAFDESQRIAGQKASAVALKRARTQFEAFLAGSDPELRYELVKDDFMRVMADVAEEYGVEAERLASAVLPRISGGAFCDDCKAWKKGPSKLCTCDGGEKSNDDDPDDGSSVESSVNPKVALGPDDHLNAPGPEDPIDQVRRRPDPGNVPTGPLDPQGLSTPPDIQRLYDELDAAQAAGNQQLAWEIEDALAKRQASTWIVVGEALKTVDLPKGDATALGDPSPKMDKGTWKPNATNPEGNLHPIDTEGTGSPNPTEHQDIVAKPDHTKDPTTDQIGEATTEHQDVGKEGDIESIRTDTWHGDSGQANPVTSAKAPDPDKNPIREMLTRGVLPDVAVQQAISAYRS